MCVCSFISKALLLHRGLFPPLLIISLSLFGSLFRLGLAALDYLSTPFLATAALSCTGALVALAALVALPVPRPTAPPALFCFVAAVFSRMMMRCCHFA